MISSLETSSSLSKLFDTDFEMHRQSLSFAGISLTKDKGILAIIGIIFVCRCTIASIIDQCSPTIHENIMKAMLVMIILFLYLVHKYFGSYKKFIHILAVPFILAVVVKKHFDVEASTFHLGECFCTFLLITVFSSLNSPLQYYTVQLINILCIGTFYVTMIVRYGIHQIGFEFYYNMTLSLALIAFIHRQKDSLLKSNFINTSLSQMRERKWKSILSQLTEGVLILEKREKYDQIRVFFSNASLSQIAQIQPRNQGLSKEFLEQNYILENQGSSSKKKQAGRKFSDQSNGSIEYKLDQIFQDVHFQYAFNSPVIKEGIKHRSSLKLQDHLIQLYEEFSDSPTGTQFKEFIKISSSRRVLELQIQKIEDDKEQVLFLFKEVSSYKRLQFTKTKEKFTNLFLNTTAHNLFTPINGMIGVSQMLEKEIETNQQALKYISMINNCLSGLVFTVHNIMELSKIRLNNFKTVPKYINIYDKINNILEILEDQINQKNLRIDNQCTDILINTEIEIDEPRFGLVLYNILSNSVKYTRPNDQIIIRAKLVRYHEMVLEKEAIRQQQEYGSSVVTNSDASLSVASTVKDPIRESAEYLKVTIRDTGLGMKDDVIKGLFELFGNCKMSNNVNQQGIGLGLTVSNQICKQLGGSLFIESSEPKKGSKFTFYIPIQLYNHLQSSFSNFNKINSFRSNSGSIPMSINSGYFNSRQESKIIHRQNLSSQVFNTEPSYKNQQTYPFKPAKKKSNKSQFCKLEVDYDNIESDDSLENQALQESILVNLESDEEENKTQQDELFFPDSPLVKGKSFENYNTQKLPNQSSLVLQQLEDNIEVLIVDDTNFNLEVLQMMLQSQFNLMSEIAFSGEEALQKIQERVFNNNLPCYKLIIMDINMPGMDGVTCTQQIRKFLLESYENLEDPYIVAHTAITQDQFGDYRSKGFDDFLCKPVFYTKLEQIVNVSLYQNSGSKHYRS
ncbi:multi-sensor hybrid histidine kinase [Stylonychia lemnae]|uniref:Multi-sensor hybrid histidine kinase n=1 Tax=Stylonychia lemnae TaxID=5949 RepID=A0A078AAK5_STYLE|nr:multi-sensor hybrid histidine kinase [Stylonychia lemnae]|eukprot:CDW77828.1 multi-sensor hybrid histidine kinase [Stylonychia lemnae]